MSCSILPSPPADISALLHLRQLVAAEAMDSQVALRAAATKDAHAKWEQLGEKGQAHFKELAKGEGLGLI